MIDNAKSVGAIVSVTADVEEVLTVIADELASFFRGEKEGNFGKGTLARVAATRTNCHPALAVALVDAFVKKAELKSKKGPDGGFQRPTLVPPAPQSEVPTLPAPAPEATTVAA